MTRVNLQIDFNQIDFPSDPVTLKHLRSRQVDFEDDALELILMHKREQEFAELGFVTALGDPKELQRVIDTIIQSNDDPDVSYDEAKFVQEARDALMDNYMQFGIADGPATARQLIHRLEESGANLAKQQLPGLRR